MVRVSPLATASWVARVPHRRAATATAPSHARRGAGARRTQPDAAAKRPDPRLVKSSSPLSAATWRGLFGEGRLAGNDFRPVKPTNPVVPSGALGRTMANSGPQRLARPAKAGSDDPKRPEGPDEVGVGSTASPTTSPDARTSASATAPRSG